MRFARSPRGWLLVTTMLGLWPAGAALAWNDHTLCTWQALEGLGELGALRVRAESLETFLARQAPQLERVLAEHEAWARAHLEHYAPRPDELAFEAPVVAAATSDPVVELRQRFLKALRLNVSSRLPLFQQLPPGEAPGRRRPLPWTEVTTLASGSGARDNTYVELAEGSLVAVADVVATASAEPDYGLDLGLFADSGTAHGRVYGFGNQPFGNPKLEYGTQAPFHMGFYHEARIVFAAGGFLRRTQPEARIALFMALSRHALASGHDYWGWRFAGWAAHYVQDLTQPYHASTLPGVHPARMIGVGVAAMAGWEGPKLDAITLASNRHVVLENYQHKRMAQAYEQRRLDDPLLTALRDVSQDPEHWQFRLGNVRELIAREAFDAAPALDAQLEKSFPPRYAADPAVNLGTEMDALDMYGIARQHSAPEHERLERHVAALLKRLGLHTRALMRELLAAKAPPPVRP